MTPEDEIRKRILSAAMRILFNQGVRNLKMDDLAAELYISKKTIYRYFKSKDDLVREIMSFMEAKIAGEQNELLEKAKTPLEKVFAVFSPVYRLLPQINRFVLEDIARLYPDIWESLNAYRVRRLMLLRDIIADGVEEGVFRPVDPDIAASFLTITITNFIQPENLLLLGITPREGFEFLVTNIFLGLVSEDRRSDFMEMFNSVAVQTPKSQELIKLP